MAALHFVHYDLYFYGQFTFQFRYGAHSIERYQVMKRN